MNNSVLIFFLIFGYYDKFLRKLQLDVRFLLLLLLRSLLISFTTDSHLLDKT